MIPELRELQAERPRRADLRDAIVATLARRGWSEELLTGIATALIEQQERGLAPAAAGEALAALKEALREGRCSID